MLEVKKAKKEIYLANGEFKPKGRHIGQKTLLDYNRSLGAFAEFVYPENEAEVLDKLKKYINFS